MKAIEHNGEEGIFIPFGEYYKGRFFSEEELVELQQMVLSQREAIVELQKELLR